MQAEITTGSLPEVKEIEFTRPLAWLAGGWSDFRRALLPCLAYGLALAIVSLAFILGILF